MYLMTIQMSLVQYRYCKEQKLHIIIFVNLRPQIKKPQQYRPAHQRMSACPGQVEFGESVLGTSCQDTYLSNGTGSFFDLNRAYLSVNNGGLNFIFALRANSLRHVWYRCHLCR